MIIIVGLCARFLKNALQNVWNTKKCDKIHCKMLKNCTAAAALPQTSRELTMLPRPPIVGRGGDKPYLHTYLSTPSASHIHCLRRLIVSYPQEFAAYVLYKLNYGYKRRGHTVHTHSRQYVNGCNVTVFTDIAVRTTINTPYPLNPLAEAGGLEFTL